MFEFLHEMYADKALTLQQLEQGVTDFNSCIASEKKIKAVNLSEGKYVSLNKYLAKSQKYKMAREEVRLKERKCMEMRMRILLLEQRLHAYEYMFTDMQEQPDDIHI